MLRYPPNESLGLQHHNSLLPGTGRGTAGGSRGWRGRAISPTPSVSALRCHLPEPTDIDRLSNLCGELYITAQVQALASAHRHPAVERTIREVSPNHPVRPLRRGPVGHVRVRSPLRVCTPTVALFDGASRLHPGPPNTQSG